MSEITRKSRRGIKLLVLIVVLAAGYIYLRNCSWMSIQAIYVFGNDTVLSEELIAMSGLEPGQNILAVDLDEISQVISYHPMIKNVELSRRFPMNIAITVEERQAWAVVRFQDSFLCLDSEGYCIDKRPGIDIARNVIISFDELPEYATLGRPFKPEAIKAIRSIWEGLEPGEREQLSEFYYTVANNEVIIYTVSGTEIRFGDTSRQDEKMGLLKKSLAMENSFQADNQQAIEYIDLRFSGQPVIKTRN